MSENKHLFPGVKPGETFKIGDMEFIRFADTPAGTPVVLKDIAFRSRFGDNNDFRNSVILKKLQEEFLPKIIEAVGDENICEFETDLITLDGLKPYGTMKSRISLPTMDFYRANADAFSKYKSDRYWWLATPESAMPNESPYWILCVTPSGFINFGIYYGDRIGVRPFCILKSSIFESVEE